MTDRRYSRLPKWAQKAIADRDNEIRRLRSLETAHAVLVGREWFTIRGDSSKTREHFRLWRLTNDDAISLCSIGPGDILLIGRGEIREIERKEERG